MRMSDRKITSTFKLVFCTVVGLTVLSGGMALKLASQEELSPQQTRVFETCSATWQMGVGAIFGLLGGKATELLHQAPEEDGQ
jgi:hypothetical protein